MISVAAQLDRLTGLPNGQVFRHHLTELAGAARPKWIGICHIDLDRFDAVNQALGHEVGDRLLVQAARRLTQLAIQPGHLVARLGNDRFGILVQHTGAGGRTETVARQALELLAEPFVIERHQLAITASAGVVEKPAFEADPVDVMSEASTALHWAKADGKAQCRIFEPERNAREVRRNQLWLAMPAALACGQFTLHYQPLVDLRLGHVVGAEALARWNHPEHGLLGPEDFIALAEETGLIVPLGAMLLKQACQDAVHWAGPDAPYVSVNLAAAQLRDPTLYTTVRNTLSHTGLDPNRLQLEITEHSVIDTGLRTLETLRSLADLGVRIAIDDFGTGYSNLAMLPELPLCELKLAHPFIQRCDEEGSRLFLANIVRLAKALNLNMTAEGIETPLHADLMREVGCDTGQGWHFGKPTPVQVFAAYLSERRRSLQHQ